MGSAGVLAWGLILVEDLFEVARLVSAKLEAKTEEGRRYESLKVEGLKVECAQS